MSTNISEAQRNSTFQITVNIGTSRIIIKCTACMVHSEFKYSHDLQKVIPPAVFAPLQHNYSLRAHDSSAIRQTTACLTHSKSYDSAFPRKRGGARSNLKQFFFLHPSATSTLMIILHSTVGLILALRAEEPEASTRGQSVDDSDGLSRDTLTTELQYVPFVLHLVI